MNLSLPRLAGKHVKVLLGVWAAVLLLGVAIASRASGSLAGSILAASPLMAFGPFAGGICRGQRCCLVIGLQLLPWCGGALAVGALLQALIVPRFRYWPYAQLVFWGIGLFLWFGGALVSFAHAFS